MIEEEEEEDTKYFVGVKLDGTSKSYYFSTEDGDLKIGDPVVVETVSGLEMGHVSGLPRDMGLYKSSLLLKPVLRKATQDDIDDYEFNLEESKRALRLAEQDIRELDLPMNHLTANYTLDGEQVTITYTSDGRVDFRELLKILAGQLHCRINLRQIAPRDKAKAIGGIGTCGLPLCCSTFLTDFEGISISRAKNQMLTINVPKLSGPCGKLICCLLFEDDMYTEAKKEFPRVGTVVHMEDGDYTVSSFNILSRQVKLMGKESIRYLSLEDTKDAIAGVYKPNAKPMVSETAAPETGTSWLHATDQGHEERPENGKNGGRPAKNQQNGGQRNNGQGGRHRHHGHGGNNNQNGNRPNNNNPQRQQNPSQNGGQNQQRNQSRNRHRHNPQRSNPQNQQGQNGGSTPKGQ